MKLPEFYGRVVVFTSSLLLLVALLYPIQSTVVPEWKVTVVDVYGERCANMQVRQTWDHYSYYRLGGGDSESALTDSDGIATLPPRTIRASFVRRLFVPPLAFVGQIAHGSFGPDSSVSATGIKGFAWLRYTPGKPLPEQMVVEKCIRE